MGDRSPLLEVGPSAPLLLVEADPKDAAEGLWVWREAGLTVRVVRGHKMRTVDALFDEFSAALQFPHYFGENWPAFDECLADMDWLPMHAGIVISVRQPGEVLSRAPDVELEVLARTIMHAAETYGQPITSGEWWDRPAVPFHVVLQASPGEGDDVIRRWAAVGASVVPFGR